MSYDFTDPKDQERFRVEAVSKGASIDATNKYISKRRSEQEISKYGIGSSGESLAPESSGISPETDFGRKMLNARVAGKEALDVLNAGQETGPISSRLQKIGEFFGSTEGTDYRSKLNAASSQLFNALAGATQSPAELKRLEKMMPKDTDQETVAKQKLQTLIDLLDQQMQTQGVDTSSLEQLGENQTPSDLISQTTGEKVPQDFITESQIAKPEDFIEPNVNMSGGLAEIGDLVRDPKSGKLKIHGDLQDDGHLVKIDKALGLEVDNNLIKWLADSQFLPIVGGIGGSILGGIAGGAVGAAGGKAIQQGLLELENPDKQDLSSAARAVLVEGMVDALFSVATLGIGKVAGKAMGLVLTKQGSATAKGILRAGEEGTQALSKEALEGGGKRLLGKSQEDLIRKAYKLSLSEKAGFQETYGSSFYKKLIQFLDGDLSGLVSPESAIDVAKAGKKVAGKEIAEKLSGRAINANKVLPEVEQLIEGLKKPFLSTTGESYSIIPSEYAAGVARLEEKIGLLKGIAAENGGYIPLQEVQSLKVSLNNSFKGIAEEVSSKKLLQKGRNVLMKTIEEYGGEGIRESNLKYYVFDLLKDSAIKADEKVVTAAFDAIDIIVAGTGTAISGGNVAFGAASVAVGKLLRSVGKDPFTQLKIINKIGKYAVEKGNRNALRAILMTAQKFGIPMGIDEILIKSTLRFPQLINDNQSPQDFIQSVDQTNSPNQFIGQ